MKTFKNVLAIALLIISSFGFAQPRRMMTEEKKDEIEAMKIGYLTRKLDLSPEEAKSFWPVYNQFQNELQAIRKSKKSETHNSKEDFEKMSDKDVEKIVDNEIAFRQNELDVIKKYHAQFKQVLPVKKVAVLYRTEEDFKRELLKRIQERRGGSGNRQNPPPDGE